MTKIALRRVLIVLGAMALLAVVAFGPAVVTDFTKSKPSTPALATVALNSFPVVAKATGTLFPQQLMYVNFAIGGQLSETDVKVGDAVSVGQKLARLDQSAQQAALVAAQASLAAARAALANAYATGNSQAAAAAAAQVANGLQQVQKATTDLNNTTLLAPEAATVLQINSQAGESLSAGTSRVPTLPGSGNGIIDPSSAGSTSTAFIVLGSATQYQVSAAFSEANAAQLSSGQTGTIAVDALPGLSIPGIVNAIASGATQVNGVPEYYASVAADGTDPRLRNGMTVNVSIDIAQASSVLTVPSQAVFSLNNGQFVDVWYKGAAIATQVRTGRIGEKLIEVTAGLRAGQQVVLNVGQALLPSGPPTPT